MDRNQALWGGTAGGFVGMGGGGVARQKENHYYRLLIFHKGATTLQVDLRLYSTLVVHRGGGLLKLPILKPML